MKSLIKIITVVCTLAMLLGTLSALLSAAEYEYEKPVEPSKWTSAKFSTDHAYSIALVGDTQYLSCGDVFQGTKKMNQLYKYIADTAEERKLAHVFVLGDITDRGSWNDGQLAGKHYNPPRFEEWDNAFEAIMQLSDAGVSYSLCRGNHDDYSMDTYFNIPKYTDQFKGCGGFFSDVDGKYTKIRTGGEADMTKRNPDKYILWSAKKYAETGNGRYTESIVNSYKTMEIGGTKYLFVTLDFNPTKATIDWLDGLLSEYSDHKAIIATHSYLIDNGELNTNDSNSTNYHFGFVGHNIWKVCLRKHENVFMVVSGHTGGLVPIYSVNTGDNGNKVYQVLCDAQFYDAKEDESGNIVQGKQDTGLVLYMNFSKDGKTITFDYYSTLLNKFVKDSDYKINIEEELDEVGSIDMAGLSEFGQTTPLITENKTPKLDGSVSEGEYSEVKVTKKEDIGRGKLNSDITEYFAYDDEYLYYAFTAKCALDEYRLNFRMGSSLYTVAELNTDEHNEKATIMFKNGSCKLGNLMASKILKDDMQCFASRDTKSGITTYEIKISRRYLSANNSPDNLLSYTLNLGSATHHFNLSDEAKAYLKDLGVTKEYDWTYNYVYFGSRPETVPDAPETTEPIETEAVSSNSGSVNTDVADTDVDGCGAVIGGASMAFITAFAGAAILVDKRRANKKK